MIRKNVIIIMCIIFVVISSVACENNISNSVGNMENLNKKEFLYEGESGIEFVCMSMDEFNNKINAGDVRSINQESIDGWNEKAKDLYSKWYDIGYVPSLVEMEDSQLYSYNYSDEMVGISFVSDYEQSDYYYDIITISENLQKNGVEDIEEYYINHNSIQNENLKLAGGSYKSIEISGKQVKAAVVEFDDGTTSVDFVWDDKYWIRMWDTETQLIEILRNFEVEENTVRKPENFDDKDFNGKVEKPDITSVDLTSIDNEASTFALSRQNNNQVNKIMKIFKNRLPSIDLPQEIMHNYILESTEYIEGEVCYIKYDYKNILNDNIISIEITPDVYVKNNVEMYPEIYMKKFNSTNPYRFNQEMAEKYGVYTMDSYANISNYTINQENLPSNVDLAFEYCKEGYDYSEYIILVNNRFIKISCEDENQVDMLKQFMKCVDVYVE